MPDPLEPTRAVPVPRAELSDSAPAFVPPRVERVGRFAVRAVLGEGAFGTVYLAHDPDLDRTVALKVPHPGTVEPGHHDRFVREARAAAAIHHPNVCPVYEVCTGDRPFIVMYHVAGPTLGQFLGARPGPLPVPLALALAHKLALGVAAAHDRGVTHRDLKPGNVLCDPVTGEVLVTDFGLARLSDGSHSTADGAVLGTPAYMSPEQARGAQAEVGPASDVYALGALLYRLLTGDVPFRGSVFEVLAQHATAQPPAPSASVPELDARLDALCAKALAKCAADRFPHARAFADAVLALAHETGADVSGRLPFETPGATVVRPSPPTLPVGLQPTTVIPPRPAPAPPTGRTGRFVALLVLLTATVGALALFWPQLRDRFARRPDPAQPPAPVPQVEVAPMPRAKGAPKPPEVPAAKPKFALEQLVGVWERQGGTPTDTYWEFWADGTNEKRNTLAPGSARRAFTLDGDDIVQTLAKGATQSRFTVEVLDTDDLVVRLRVGREEGLRVRYKRVPPAPKPVPPDVTPARLVGVWNRTAPSAGVTWEFTKEGNKIVTSKGPPVAQPFAIKDGAIHAGKAVFTVVRLTETELVVKQKDAEQAFRRAKDKPHSAKDVMRALHLGDAALMKPLEAAVLKPDWRAARDRADEVAELAAVLAKSAPPKGNAASWDKLTGAHLQAARDLLGATAAQDAAKARIHLNTLQRSCVECHKVHK